jgi:ribosomally synthesized peptide (two-chain TOMM family)
MSWKNPEFAAALFAQEDARDLVQGAMNYLVQWNFRLRFHPVAVRTNPDPKGWADIVVSSLMRSTITVYLPRRPEPDDVQACALGAYNDTGSAYPFTCA